MTTHKGWMTTVKYNLLGRNMVGLVPSVEDRKFSCRPPFMSFVCTIQSNPFRWYLPSCLLCFYLLTVTTYRKVVVITYTVTNYISISTSPGSFLRALFSPHPLQFFDLCKVHFAHLFRAPFFLLLLISPHTTRHRDGPC